MSLLLITITCVYRICQNKYLLIILLAMSTPLNTLSNQYHTSSTVSNSDPSRLAHKNAGIMVQPPPTSSQMADQRYHQQQYFYNPPQQQQEHLRVEGDYHIINQSSHYIKEHIHLIIKGKGKILPPANIYIYP